MTTKFEISATGFTPIEREAIKRSIIDQGKAKRVNVHMFTDKGRFSITFVGDRETVVAYEAAVKHWFGRQSQVEGWVL